MKPGGFEFYASKDAIGVLTDLVGALADLQCDVHQPHHNRDCSDELADVSEIFERHDIIAPPANGYVAHLRNPLNGFRRGYTDRRQTAQAAQANTPNETSSSAA